MRPEIYNVSQPHFTSDCTMCAPSMILDSDCDYESDYDYDYNELSHISTNYELIKPNQTWEIPKYYLALVTFECSPPFSTQSRFP